MRFIGLTGGIGSGKSTVARMLADRGAVILDSDVLAREVVEPGTPGFEAVVARFGPDIVTPDGGVDRPALARVVFADVLFDNEGTLEELEAQVDRFWRSLS